VLITAEFRRLLPFGLGGQPVAIAGLFREPFAKDHGVFPAHKDDWQIVLPRGVIITIPSVTDSAGRGMIGRVNKKFVETIGRLAARDFKRRGENLMRWALVFCALVGALGELAFGDAENFRIENWFEFDINHDGFIGFNRSGS